MKNLIRLEEFTLAVLAIYLFSRLDLAWWWFPLFFLAPDLSMIAYLGGPTIGAYGYNLVHHKSLAIALYILGSMMALQALQFTGLILLAHSSLDRVLDYGLKFGDSFKHTHLGFIGSSE